MRIGSRGYMDVIKANLAAPADRMTRLYGQLTSGTRLQTLSDDPLAATRAVRAHAALDELHARRFVVQQGQQLLGAADTALGQMACGLSQCADLMLQSSDPGLGTSERAALASQIRNISSALITAGNTEVQGQYIFAGSKNTNAPFEADKTANLPVLYHGNLQQPVYRISPVEQTPTGFTGQQVFNYAAATGEQPIADVPTDMFSLLEQVAMAVEHDDQSQVQQLLPQIQACHAHLVGLRGQAGVITQRCERAQSAADDAQARLQQLLSDDEGLDYAGAISDLSQQQTIYQAVLGMTSRLLQMPNLFDLS